MLAKAKSSLAKLARKALKWPREAKFFIVCFSVYWLLVLTVPPV